MNFNSSTYLQLSNQQCPRYAQIPILNWITVQIDTDILDSIKTSDVTKISEDYSFLKAMQAQLELEKFYNTFKIHNTEFADPDFFGT